MGKQVLLLSLFGLAMGLGTVFFVSSRVEPFCWLIIFLISAFLIGRSITRRPFLTGFLVGLANCVWIIAAHVIFVNRYLAGHPQEAAMLANSPLSESPRLMMGITGPAIGIVSGIVIGLLSMLVSRIFRQRVMMR
jgi:hypothetical protein